MHTGVELCGAGMVALIVGAVVDVDAADPWAGVGLDSPADLLSIRVTTWGRPWGG